MKQHLENKYNRDEYKTLNKSIRREIRDAKNVRVKEKCEVLKEFQNKQPLSVYGL